MDNLKKNPCLFQYTIIVNSSSSFWINILQYSEVHTDSKQQHGNLSLFQYDQNVTGRYDQQDESLTGQIPNQARHSPVTGHYFKPWARLFEGWITLSTG